ncbi:hypothetical protein N7519_000674, partial [Penicillium mononematosum]|uniref:uncharacterized protein n=1 Tax=Penicillium mononematosum TaxID=268346 RepID=UPI002548A3AC
RAIRRTWVRTLEFDIIIPCKLLDWSTRQDQNYSTSNQVRQGNDFAFQTAIFDLFQTLHSWNQRCRLSLHLGLRVSRDNRWPIMEPEALHFPTASAYDSVDYAGRRLVEPYRARFVKNMPDRYLMHVRCIDKLFFLNRKWDKPPGYYHHQIWAGAVQTIIEHRPTITELELDLNEWVRPDYLQYIQGRRASLSSLFGNIPSSLRVVHYKGSEDGAWKHSMPALNVIPSGIDSMSTNLRDVSTHLRELKLHRTTLSFDFLCPLDGEGEPIIGSLHWPHLKTLEIEDVPPWLPSGKWVSNHTAQYRATIENNSWNDRMYDVQRRPGGPSVMDAAQFHRLLISLGYATQRMPCLKSLRFSMECYCQFGLRLQNDADAGMLALLSRVGKQPDSLPRPPNKNAKPSTLIWLCRVRYRPDSRVAKAWRFDLDDVSIDSSLGLSLVILPRWPPDNPI